MISNNIEHIVGLVGKKASGKDTFYLACLELFAIDKKILIPPKRFAFADALKLEVANKFDISIGQLNKEKEKYRKDLQDTGEARRKEDNEYWIKQVAKKLLDFDLETFNKVHCPHLVIITDVRYINEAQWIKSLGGNLIRIRRTDIPDDMEDKHSSEIELESIACNYYLDNEGPNRYNLYKMQILDTLHQLKIS